MSVVAAKDWAKVGDVLNMELGGHLGELYQSENRDYLTRRWTRAGRFEFAQALRLADTPNSIWGTGRSTKHGIFDELTAPEARRYDHSLLLIETVDLVVAWSDEGYGGVQKNKPSADFSYRGMRYCFAVTDPYIYEAQNCDRQIGHALLTCSLAEPYHWDDGSEHASKLIAAVITEERLS